MDILQQVISDICRLESGFAIQLDESTDLTNCAQLLIFVRYVGKEGIKEEFLMNAALEATTKGDDIFQMVNSFFKQYGLKWENLRGCTTDKAPAMLGQKLCHESSSLCEFFALHDPAVCTVMQSPSC